MVEPSCMFTVVLAERFRVVGANCFSPVPCHKSGNFREDLHAYIALLIDLGGELQGNPHIAVIEGACRIVQISRVLCRIRKVRDILTYLDLRLFVVHGEDLGLWQ